MNSIIHCKWNHQILTSLNFIRGRSIANHMPVSFQFQMTFLYTFSTELIRTSWICTVARRWSVLSGDAGFYPWKRSERDKGHTALRLWCGSQREVRLVCDNDSGGTGVFSRRPTGRCASVLNIDYLIKNRYTYVWITKTINRLKEKFVVRN